MDIPLRTPLAAAALAAGAILAASTALAQPAAKKPAPITDARPRIVMDEGKEQARQKQLRFDRLCTFGPVMSDAAIEGCKQAHRL